MNLHRGEVDIPFTTDETEPTTEFCLADISGRANEDPQAYLSCGEKLRLRKKTGLRVCPVHGVMP